MPDITTEPESFLPLRVADEKHFYETGFSPEAGYDEWRQRVHTNLEQEIHAIEKNKKMPADLKAAIIEKVKGVYAVFCGPILLNEKMLKRPDADIIEEEPKLADLLQSAALQQGFVHSMYFAGYGEPNDAVSQADLDDYADKMYDLIIRQQRTSAFLRERKLPERFNGIKNQFALVQTLTRNGYRVILPNYTEEDKQMGRLGQLARWDLTGMDLIAAKDGQVYGIDAKGSMGIDEVAIEDERVVDSNDWRYDRLNQELKEYGIDEPLRYRMIIRIPTKKLSRLGPKRAKTEAQEVIRNSCLLPETDEAQLITKLETISQSEAVAA